MADSLDRIAAPALDGVVAQLAASWSAQRLNWLATPLPEPRPRLVDRRDVTDRVRAIAPFFTQGSVIWPVLSTDTLYWVIDLYVAADMYPLSEHFVLAGEPRSYFQHAATAFVHAYTGRVVLVADSVRDVVADSWLRAFPSLFTSRSALAPGLAAASPPATDAASALADAFGSVGARASERAGAGPLLQPAVADNADSLMTSGQPPCIAAQSDNACATVVPLMDVTDHVVGLVVATGGAERAVVWVPLDGAPALWTSVVSRLRQAGDSVLGSRRDASTSRGRLRSGARG